MPNPTVQGSNLLFFLDSQPSSQEIQAFIKSLDAQNMVEIDRNDDLFNQMEPQHQQQNLQIFETSNSDDLSTGLNNQSSQSFSQTQSNSNSSRGSYNSVPSNLARDFIISIKKSLKSNERSMDKFIKLIEKFGIKTQKWILDGLFIILLYLRDQELIDQKEYLSIRSRFRKMLVSKKERASLSKSKQMFQIYIEHVGKYDEVQFGPQIVHFIDIHSENLLSNILIKRKKQIQKYVCILRDLFKSLNSKGSDKINQSHEVPLQSQRNQRSKVNFKKGSKRT